MAYIDRASPGNRAASVAAVITVHAALGCALYFGLQVSGVIEHSRNPIGVDIPLDPPPPPPPEADVAPEQPTPAPDIYVPPKPFELAPVQPDIATIDLPPPFDRVIERPLIEIPKPPPSPPAAKPKLADPIAAKPRNAPGRWISDNDYRTIWINREMEGIAGIRLAIGTDGRVSDCTITQSTGHEALDQATCRLITSRARFEPARDPQGNKIAGSFSSKVRWQIPE